MGLIDRDTLTTIGIIGHPHGVKGEVKVTPLTDTPDYYEAVTAVIVETEEGLRAYPVARLRLAGQAWIMTLDGIADRDAAERLRGGAVLLEDAALRPLAPGEYFHHDLVGCQVETVDGRALGRVEEILETGANDVLAVANGAELVMVPMLETVIKAVDVAARMVRIDPLPGLLDPDEAS